MSDSDVEGVAPGIPAMAQEIKKARSSNVLFGVVVLVILALLIGMSAYEARNASHRVDRATECIIEQFSEHRAANRSAHKALTEVHGTTYESEPEDRPTPAIDRLQEACAPFTKKSAEREDE